MSQLSVRCVCPRAFPISESSEKFSANFNELLRLVDIYKKIYVYVQDNYGFIVKILATANNKENQQAEENLC